MEGNKIVEVLHFDQNAVLCQSNELIEANYRLSTLEQKVFLVFCANIDQNAENFNIVKLAVKDVSSVCGLNPKNGYRQLQKIASDLVDRSLVIRQRNSKNWYKTHFVQSCKYIADASEAYIEFELDARLRPQLLQLKERFLKESFSEVASFTHIYSIRFFEIFKNRLKLGTLKLSFERIRELFNLDKKYTIKNIKAKIIKISIEEINEKSKIYVEYEYYKEGGRAHVGVIFTFRLRRILDATQLTPSAAKNEQTDEEKELLARLMNPQKWNITKVRAEQILKKYGVDHVHKNLLYADKYRSGKANLGGWLVDCIRNDYAADERARKAEQERERVKQRERDESKFKPIVPTPPTETETKNKRAGNAGALAWLAKNQK